jgi:hypothetical protein
VSALAHFFEDEGLSTVVIALVREHAQVMKPPRALWVPYELGRPFGEPKNAELQRHILKTALSLLDSTDATPILYDLEDERPRSTIDESWIPPQSLNTDLVLNEATDILPLWEQVCKQQARTTVGVSGMSPQLAVEFIDLYFDPEPIANPKGMARVSRARFAIDDIKAFYLEAALVNGGQPSSGQLYDWFWKTTLAGIMIRNFQQLAVSSNDKNLNLIAGSLVPAERTNDWQNQL